MAQYFKIHPDNPQGTLIAQAAAILRQGHAAGTRVEPADALADVTPRDEIAGHHLVDTGHLLDPPFHLAHVVEVFRRADDQVDDRAHEREQRRDRGRADQHRIVDPALCV